MADVVFTDDTYIILASLPVADVWPTRQNTFVSAQARAVLAGEAPRFRRVTQASKDTTLGIPTVISHVERRK